MAVGGRAHHQPQPLRRPECRAGRHQRPERQPASTSDFYTGAFPAEFGNALSGVYDIRLRNGNNEKFRGIAGGYQYRWAPN